MTPLHRLLAACGLGVSACSSGSLAGPLPGEDAGDASDAGLPADAVADAAGPIPGADAGDDAARSGDADARARGSYRNPVLAHDFPDPFVLRARSAYYAFATNGGGKNIQAATSVDLAVWSDLADALPTLPSWAAKNQGLTWAPSVLARPGGYVLYYTARDVPSGFQCVSRALATSPGGPYVDTSPAPFVCQQDQCGSIDASPFVDADGAAYLVWKSDANNPACHGAPRLWSQRLSDDGMNVVGAPVEMLVEDQAWESPIIEGPSMVKNGSTYYLFYSANRYESADYAVGYGTCQTALGPCQKITLDRADGVSPAVLKTESPALGPGGQEVFTDDRGATWLAYHAWTAPATSYSAGGARSLRIDRLTFAGGRPVILGPTTAPQPL